MDRVHVKIILNGDILIYIPSKININIHIKRQMHKSFKVKRQILLQFWPLANLGVTTYKWWHGGCMPTQ